MFQGKDILTVACRHRGEAYVLGAIPLLANAAWRGPWDCAEFAAWCAYQAYGIIFAVRPPDPRRGESYSDWWAQDAISQGCGVEAATALRSPGAILVRRPRGGADKRMGHVAISMGDGTTIEAKDSATGVAIVANAAGRHWDLGVHLPGVSYELLGELPAVAPPARLFMLSSPYQHGAEILAIQRRLAGLGLSPGRLDGYFGPLTSSCVQTFQAMRGLVVDGIVGPDTARALGLSWPLEASELDVQVVQDLASQIFTLPAPGAGEVDVDEDVEPRPPHADPSLGGPVHFEFRQEQDGSHYAVNPTGKDFYVGKRVSYTDDMKRYGLSQSIGLLEKNSFAKPYDPKDYAGSFPLWSGFIHPTAMAESGGLFERVNTYDRAAFTFGFYQFGAHTPGDNLILLFRKLLALPDAARYFPDLFLQTAAGGDPVVMRRLDDGRVVNLETVVDVLRPNGKQERQLKHFMDYLNPDPASVGPEELLATARLMLWTAEDPAARLAQVELAVETAKRKLKAAIKNLPSLDPGNWELAVWVSDIHHQGRARYAEVEEALKSANPLAALAGIGALKFASRIADVSKVVGKLKASGAMAGWTYPT